MHLSLRNSHSGKFPKWPCYQKQAPGCTFQYRCLALIVKIIEEILWWGATFSKLSCHTLYRWTNAAKFKYFIIALINFEQLLHSAEKSIMSFSFFTLCLSLESCNPPSLSPSHTFSWDHPSWENTRFYEDTLEQGRLETINIKPWKPVTCRNCVP